MTEQPGIDYDPAPPGYEWRVSRVPRALKALIWIVAILAVLAALWFWAFPAAQELMPGNF